MPFNPNLINFDAANALLLAEASEAAYETEAEALDLMMRRGLPNFQWIDLSDIPAGRRRLWDTLKTEGAEKVERALDIIESVGRLHAGSHD